MSEEFSVAHAFGMNHYGAQKYPDGRVPWEQASPPDIPSGKLVGRLRHCWYCGSMHPADLAAAIRAGATGDWADLKYGWPHKAYFDGIPNPHAGMLESRCGATSPPQEEIDAGKWIQVPGYDPGSLRWVDSGKPAPTTTYGKFYSVHLQDASAEDRAVIEQHLGLHFTFIAGRVGWEPIPNVLDKQT